MGNKEILRQRVEELAAKVSGEVEELSGVLILKVKGAYLSETLSAAKSFPDVPCDFLHDMTALDLKDHFEVVYQLSSLHGPQRLRVKGTVDREHPVVNSVTRLWRGANFLEREAYDMFGIEFKGHPNLKRIYLWDDFEGYPLRKDYVTESLEERSVVLPLKKGE
ncbi:NADH:ubiquinone reductase (H+-translocating) [Acididesulfobacillus acetoxydans]|uniref:NADH-quinone oxidoreductase n=1 Tax=Acididesulfobacillus acetoxydans TaxID=1561005 RepID=A0A8S0WHH3_9FIRM|nr:NADH-quinone oxidoreductase subunit C [Acididesulfobacillus acetoxydans]CAA7602702.1 NADH:ubiquinone reductase (H+-translocating) [Acididesulfobacillus acetoxydans]CEJ06441.1 NADH-quinone oxidoreductase subunit C [Acididesulfobacillus acetoxydans]